jgi:H+/Cl- antiporter ClcA
MMSAAPAEPADGAAADHRDEPTAMADEAPSNRADPLRLSLVSRHRTATFIAVIVLTGVVAGLSGMLFALLLHFIQHVAYGYSLDAVIGPESFLEGVTSASPARRVAVLTICGMVAGLGWWAVYRFGRPLVSVPAAVGKEEPGPPMPFLTTTAHALLQIVTVALGSPLGREVAPREMGALLATKLSDWTELGEEERRVAIACGAGAGLAAVYNVPLGGTVFVLEVLLGSFALKPLAAALAAAPIAAMVAWIGLGNVRQYTVSPLEISGSLIAGAIVAGPLFGIAAYGFRALVRRATSRPHRGWRRIPWCLSVFGALGLLAVLFPQLPGNGKGPSQLGFAGDLGVGLAASLLALKIVAIAASIRAGAAGGVLTPSLTIGALLATVLCYAWNLIFPSVPTAAFAVIGAGAFLASSMNMPMTAIVLTIEFTQVEHDLWLPILLAVAGSIAALRACASGGLRAFAGMPLQLLRRPKGRLGNV